MGSSAKSTAEVPRWWLSGLRMPLAVCSSSTFYEDARDPCIALVTILLALSANRPDMRHMSIGKFANVVSMAAALQLYLRTSTVSLEDAVPFSACIVGAGLIFEELMDRCFASAVAMGLLSEHYRKICGCAYWVRNVCLYAAFAGTSAVTIHYAIQIMRVLSSRSPYANPLLYGFKGHYRYTKPVNHEPLPIQLQLVTVAPLGHIVVPTTLVALAICCGQVRRRFFGQEYMRLSSKGIFVCWYCGISIVDLISRL